MITTKTVTLKSHQWTPELTLVDQFLKDYQKGEFVGIDEVHVSPALYDLFMEEAKTRFGARGFLPPNEVPKLVGISLLRALR